MPRVVRLNVVFVDEYFCFIRVYHSDDGRLSRIGSFHFYRIFATAADEARATIICHVRDHLLLPSIARFVGRGIVLSWVACRLDAIIAKEIATSSEDGLRRFFRMVFQGIR